MSERIGYWRWLLQDFIKTISSIPRHIRNPDFEHAIGFVGTIGFFFYGFDKGWVFLFSPLSYLVMMHGKYRNEVENL